MREGVVAQLPKASRGVRTREAGPTRLIRRQVVEQGRQSLLIDGDRYHERVRATSDNGDSKQVAKRAVISRAVSPHVSRHTYSVNVIQKNISLPALQRLLGHDHLATTEIYQNMSPEHVLEEFHAKW